MRLSELLQFEDIVIQCHDNPDADALASGAALHWYFTQKGKKVRFIYRGNNKIQKSNLMIMLVDLSEAKKEFGAVCEDLDALGKEIGVDIRMQSEQIFTAMHRI